MNLDDVAARLRHRDGVQALDLGLLLGRRFWSAILKPWCALVVPLLVIVQVAVAAVSAPWLAVAMGWWLKPLADRVTLHVVSRRFFGGAPTTKETMVEMLDQWISLDGLADLTWRRLSPMRSLTMPVRILEGNERREVKGRIQALYDGESRLHGWLLTAMGLGFKGLCYASIAVLIIVLTPDELVVDEMAALEYLMEDAESWVIIAVVVSATTVVTTLVEPFFAAGGFGIYIQRRVEREGWDLEIRFRRLIDRIQHSVDTGAALVLAVGLTALLGLSVAAPVPAHSYSPSGDAAAEQQANNGAIDADKSKRPPDDGQATVIPVDDPQAELDEIMEGSPFSPPPKTETQWVPVDDGDDDGDSWLDGLESWLESLDGDGIRSIQSVLASGLRVGAWLVFGVVLVLVIWKIASVFKGRSADTLSSEDGARWQEELFDGEDDAVELPEDRRVADAARTHWERGDERRALALMVLGSLLRFEQRYDTEFRAGWTTSTCARHVQDKRPEGPVIASVARAFDELAWAGCVPTAAEFEALVADYERVFENPTGGDDG